jgi:hypothetical protein
MRDFFDPTPELDRVTGADPSVTDYVLKVPASLQYPSDYYAGLTLGRRIAGSGHCESNEGWI